MLHIVRHHDIEFFFLPSIASYSLKATQEKKGREKKKIFLFFSVSLLRLYKQYFKVTFARDDDIFYGAFCLRKFSFLFIAVTAAATDLVGAVVH